MYEEIFNIYNIYCTWCICITQVKLICTNVPCHPWNCPPSLSCCCHYTCPCHHKQLSQVKGSQSTATSFNINFFLVKDKLWVCAVWLWHLIAKKMSKSYLSITRSWCIHQAKSCKTHALYREGRKNQNGRCIWQLALQRIWIVIHMCSIQTTCIKTQYMTYPDKYEFTVTLKACVHTKLDHSISQNASMHCITNIMAQSHKNLLLNQSNVKRDETQSWVQIVQYDWTSTHKTAKSPMYWSAGKPAV